MRGNLLLKNARLRADNTVVPTDIRCESGRIAAIDRELRPSPGDEVFDAGGRAVLPGFIDCHTHACWAGHRLDEWERKLRGASYLELLAAGGGILSTVRAVRQASESDLTDTLLRRLEIMLRHGTTTAEVKSGYGLDTGSELKMLAAITEAGHRWPGTIVPTACIGHAKDPDLSDGGVRRTIDETLPAVTGAFPGITIDAYCEQGSWSLSETMELVDRALSAGHPVRIHADQFNDLGCVEACVGRNIRSVDHLEASSDDTLRKLAGSRTFGVMLPTCGFHLDGRYANGRALLDAGGRLAIATNFNPGSAPCPAMPMVVALAVRHLGLTIDEALRAATHGAAGVLDLRDRGEIEVGQRADLVLLDTADARDIAFQFGWNPVSQVWVRGRHVV